MEHGEFRNKFMGEYTKDELSKKNRRDELDFIVISDILKNHLLPHVGTSYKAKALNLGYMVRELLDVYFKQKPTTDKDSFINKTCDLSGFLFGTIFL